MKLQNLTDEICINILIHKQRNYHHTEL